MTSRYECRNVEAYLVLATPSIKNFISKSCLIHYTQSMASPSRTQTTAEDTIRMQVLRRRRWGRTAVLSGYEAETCSHQRLACYLLSDPTAQLVFFSATRISQTRAESAKSLDKNSAQGALRAACTSLLLDVITSFSPALAWHPCRACAAAHPTWFRRVRRSAPLNSADYKFSVSDTFLARALYVESVP